MIRQTLLIIRTDLRRLQGPLIAWIGVLIADVFLTIASAASALNSRTEVLINFPTALLTLVEMLMVGLLVSWIIHDEPLGGNDPFWMTRPIKRGALLTAKLALAGVVLLLVPIAGDVIEMVWFGASPRDVLLAAPVVALSEARWLVLLLTIAVLTPTLTRFVVTIAACVAGFVTVFGVTLGVLAKLGPKATHYDGPVLPDLTSGIVLTVLLMAAALGVIVYQFRNRRRDRAILVGVAGCFAAALITSVWPWRFAAATPDPGAWAHDAARTPAILEPVPRDANSDTPPYPATIVVARIRLDGAPNEYSTQSVDIRSQLDFPDGKRLENIQHYNRAIRRPSTDPTSDRLMRLQAVLGDVRVAPEDGDHHDSLPIVLDVRGADYERYGGQAGHLTASLTIHLDRLRVVGLLPLTAGAVLRNGGDRFEITSVRRRADRCEVLMRQLRVTPLWVPALPRNFQFVLRNSGHREAIEGDNRMAPTAAFSQAGFFGWSVDKHPVGLSVWAPGLTFPTSRISPDSTVRLDAVWLDGAELVVIESAYAGRVTRSLTVDGFRMRP